MAGCGGYFSAFHNGIIEQYGISSLNLSNNDKFQHVLNAGEKAFKRIFDRQAYSPADLLEIDEYRRLIETTANTFNEAISHDVPEAMRTYLQQDAFIFSGLKADMQLRQARELLRDESGGLRSYADFEQEVLKLNKSYNRRYLETEYEFAAHSSQSAARWAGLQNDTKRYHLQYRTAGDERVRESHVELNRITLPKDDPFWDKFYPPNGWNCFVAGTLVLTNDGWSKIENIEKWGKLIGGSGNVKRVTGTHRNNFNGNIITIFAKREKVSCTPNHRFLTHKGWVRAEHITSGDILIQISKVGFFGKIMNAICNSITIIQYGFMSLIRQRKTITANQINT